MDDIIYGDTKDIKRVVTNYQDMPVYAFDTETPNFTPRVLTISDGEEAWLWETSPENILDDFLGFFRKLRFKEAIVFAHNLYFDMTVLLNQVLQEFLQAEFLLEYRDVMIKFFNDKPYFGEIIYKEGKVLHLRDTFAFFGRIKLDRLGKALGCGEKLKLNQEQFEEDWDEITEEQKSYAKEDARLTARIGCKIMEFHALENIKLCVSGPQMSMSVFKKRYIPWGSQLTAPHGSIMTSFEKSYHGGKNGCYVETPCEIKNASLFDINSAYPFAMTQIPSFLDCDYVVKHGKQKFNPKAEGIYNITALSRCKFNSTFAHDFTPLKTLRDVWITSYELRSLLDLGCFDRVTINSSIMIVEKAELNPLGHYAAKYYELKQNEPKESPMYLYYKICMLNALYGKFIERRYDPDMKYAKRGPNYNPAIASMITGHARAYLHYLEHESDAIHSATDSVFTQSILPESKGLGGLSMQGAGVLDLFRCKLYLFYDRTEKKCSCGFQGQKPFSQCPKCGIPVFRFAKHGFQGTPAQLINMWRTKEMEYEYKKMPTVAEVFLHKKLKLKPFGLNVMKGHLNKIIF